MTLPSITRLYDVIDHTWPAAARHDHGPFTIRQGAGGGSRVSAATLNTSAAIADLRAAEQMLCDLGQPLLFMVKDGQDDFDAQLSADGYVIKDPCNLYAAPIAQDRPSHKTCFPAYPPLAAQADIWAKGGVGPARLAIMERARGPKTSILGRVGDTPAGTVYAGIHDGIAMLHALEIDPALRRNGLGRHLTRGVAQWGQSLGAQHLALITTQANVGANALYTSLGMQVVGHYHYRIKSEK